MKKIIVAGIILSSASTSAQAVNWHGYRGDENGKASGHCNTTVPFPGLGWLGDFLKRPCPGA
jgi:hypothetical protein